jgi:hypothetical protein
VGDWLGILDRLVRKQVASPASHLEASIVGSRLFLSNWHGSFALFSNGLVRGQLASKSESMPSTGGG